MCVGGGGQIHTTVKSTHHLTIQQWGECPHEVMNQIHKRSFIFTVLSLQQTLTVVRSQVHTCMHTYIHTYIHRYDTVHLFVRTYVPHVLSTYVQKVCISSQSKKLHTYIRILHGHKTYCTYTYVRTKAGMEMSLCVA